MELNKKSDYQLIKEINKNSSSEAYLELKRRNEKCYYNVLSKFCQKVPALKYDELVEEVDEVLLKSIKSYNVRKKTKFSSWTTNHSRYHVLNTIKNLTELGHFIPTENLDIDLINNTNNKYHFDIRSDLKEHIFKILDNFKDKRAKTIFEMRFFGDKHDRKWKTISSKLNISTQQTVNIFSAAKKQVYKEMIKEDNRK